MKKPLYNDTEFISVAQRFLFGFVSHIFLLIHFYSPYNNSTAEKITVLCQKLPFFDSLNCKPKINTLFESKNLRIYNLSSLLCLGIHAFELTSFVSNKLNKHKSTAKITLASA